MFVPFIEYNKKKTPVDTPNPKQSNDLYYDKIKQLEFLFVCLRVSSEE